MKPGNVWIIAKKDFSDIINEKTIVFAILLQLLIALFSSFLLVSLSAMYDPSSLSETRGIYYRVAYVGEDSGIREGLEESRDLIVYEMDLDEAVALLKERQLNAVIYVPEVDPVGEGPVWATLYVIKNDIRTSVVTVKLKEILLDYETELRALRAGRIENPPVEIWFPESQGPGFYEFVVGLLIPLLVFMPAIISSALVIDLITEEFQNNTLETLLSTAVTFPEVAWGKLLAAWMIVPLQSGVWLLLLALNGIMIANPAEILMHVSAGSAVLILIGAATAVHYRERTNAQFVFSTAVVVLVLLAMAIPLNPLNMIVRLSVDTIGDIHWLMLAVTIFIVMVIGVGVHLYARYVGERVTQ